ncbi:hypothetical protein D9M69_585890 [compost metagenome]
MTDELQAEPIEFGDGLRRNLHGPGLQFTGLFLREGQAGGHLIVDQHVDLRKVGQQRR